MVLIHLAKMTLLNTSCEAFGPILVPPKVRDEVFAGKEKGYPDATIVERSLQAEEIKVIELGDQADEALAELRSLTVRGGEAEAIALCWQEGIERLATDDDNVRNKQEILGIQCVGTPALLLSLYRQGSVDKEKVHRALDVLDRVGWFSQAVLDKVMMEVDAWETQ